MHLHLPLFPKKKKRRTNQIKPTEQIPLQPPLKLLQFHFSLHKFQNRYIDIQIKKFSNPSKKTAFQVLLLR